MISTNKILYQFKEHIKTNNYVITLHAKDELDEDNLSIFDMEHAILTGNIIEKQRDNNSNEWKYLIHGKTLSQTFITVVAKMSITGKMIIITVFRDD